MIASSPTPVFRSPHHHHARIVIGAKVAMTTPD
jgi:hypothetical protein